MNDEHDAYDETSHAPMSYAHPDSVQGLLQRGRGLGAVRAARDPGEAAGFVYDGIRRDGRWDGTDQRSVYLARLVGDLKLSPAPLVEQLAGDEEENSRACEVLELLALAGSDEAREGLRAYVRHGEHWAGVLESVAADWPAEWGEDLGDVARARIGTEEERPWGPVPWARWGIEVQGPPSEYRPSLMPLDTAELLALLAGEGTDRVTKFDALRALNDRTPTEELIPLVPTLGTSDGRRPLPQLRRAVDRLGALAVPAAHGWARDDRPWLAELGAHVIAEHPGPEALPGLVADLAGAWAARSWCGPDVTARRLSRLGPAASEALPYLRRFWLASPHSYERTAYLEAMAAIDGGDLSPLYAESLWDCESRTRLLAVTTAPATPETLARIADLRDDPMETPEVRTAAGARLAAATDGPGRASFAPRSTSVSGVLASP
ncbi:hypothetical protein [Streptomyces venezuelae]|uniref:hypothetical protein n=1 Tax=Streptomyces venezuelae TaxID=54571 RepID=UPI00278C8BC3|nr:hypothetical protein [Streptomyces venezuelae]